MFKSFSEFIKKQNVINFAVAFMIGSAMTKYVNDFVTDLINPFAGIALGMVKDLESANFQVGQVKIMYGHFLLSTINFVVLVTVVFIIVTSLDRYQAHQKALAERRAERKEKKIEDLEDTEDEKTKEQA